MSYTLDGFYVQTFQTNVWIASGIKSEELTEIIREDLGMEWKEERPTWAAKCLEVTTDAGRYVLIIALKDRWTGDREDYANLAHEAFHAAEYICQRVCIRYGEETSEVFAYLTGSITRRCAALLDSHADGERGEWMRHKAARVDRYFQGVGLDRAGRPKVSS